MTLAAHRILNSNTKGVKSCKVQSERSCRKVKKSHQEWEALLTETIYHIIMVDTNDSIATRDFNEDTWSKNMQKFMIETGLCGTFG